MILTGRSVRCVRFGTFPSTAQGLVETDQIGGHGPIALGQLILEGEERTLGVQHVAEVHQPHPVLVLGQLHGRLSGGSGRSQGLPSVLLLCIGHQHIFYFFLGVQDRGFVLNQGLFLARRLHLDILADSAALKNIPGDARSYAPGAAVGGQTNFP